MTTTGEAERHLERIGAESSAASNDAVVRTFEVSGLSDAAVGQLSTAAAETGVTVVSNPAAVAGATADGGDPAPQNAASRETAPGRTVLLFGTPRGYDSLSTLAPGSGDDHGLNTALETIMTVLKSP